MGWMVRGGACLVAAVVGWGGAVIVRGSRIPAAVSEVHVPRSPRGVEVSDAREFLEGLLRATPGEKGEPVHAGKNPFMEEASVMKAGGNPEWRKSAAVYNAMNWEVGRLAETGAADVILRDFKRDKVGVREAERTLLAEMPEAVALDPVEARMKVDQLLFPKDPARSVVLLEGLSPAERTDLLHHLDSASLWRGERFREFVRLVPFQPADGPPSERSWAMSRHAFGEGGEACRDWALALPPGSDRDLALLILSRKLEDEEPEEAARLQRQIVNFIPLDR